MHEYEKDSVERKFPYCDYVLTRKNDDWQYGFAGTGARFDYQDFDLPFTREKAPVIAEVEMVPINWGYKDGFDGTVARDEPLGRKPAGKKRQKKKSDPVLPVYDPEKPLFEERLDNPLPPDLPGAKRTRRP